MTKTWEEQFGPVSGGSMAVRPGQARLGQKIIDAIDSKSALLSEAPTGTGKSWATLIPAIHAVKDRGIRVAVSTETTSLQAQLIDKDLPFLHGIYGDFTYRVLKGRSWYLCLPRAKTHSYGNPDLVALVGKLEKTVPQHLGEGEQADVERVLGKKISQEDWEKLCGEAAFCGENKCKDEMCWSTRARGLALGADIVVCNHNVLQTDADMRQSEFSTDGLLGDVEVIIVDEAHKLEEVLIQGWKREVTPWGLRETEGAIADGLQTAASVVETVGAARKVEGLFKDINMFLTNAARFYSRMYEAEGKTKEQWARSDWQMKLYFLSGNPSSGLISAMNAYEDDTESLLGGSLKTLDTIETLLTRGAKEADSAGLRGIRKIRKAQRLTKELRSDLDMMRQAVKTRDGIVSSFGVPYAIIANGRTHDRYGDQITVEIVPIDVSARCAKTVWNGRTPILVSATLADPINPGDFRYVAMSLGLENVETLMVESPFDHAGQQLIYVTPGTYETVPVDHAQFSMKELIAVLEATQGRALVLFTATAEMAYAAAELRKLKERGGFHHELLVQERGVDKQELFNQFRDEESSVLLASKSAFTGVNFEGSTCSAVILVKATLYPFNALTRCQIAHWKKRGQPGWYDRVSLTVFAQAVGRLIRVESDRGVAALLDRRMSDPTEKVFTTFSKGISATGSRVTSDLQEVVSFLR